MKQGLTVSALFALVLVAPSFAQAAEEQREVVVRLGDLDMTTERGASRALHRIRRAAQDICSPVGPQTFDLRIATRACVQDAMARAVQDLANPLVSAQFNGADIYAQRGGRAERS